MFGHRASASVFKDKEPWLIMSLQDIFQSFRRPFEPSRSWLKYCKYKPTQFLLYSLPAPPASPLLTFNMKLLLLGGLVSAVSAFPGMANVQFKRQSIPTLPLSQNEGNSGPIDSTSFDPQDQYVDVTPGSANEYQAPGPGDLRGPCPGLNAAANHGFLPRSGITTIGQSMFHRTKLPAAEVG